MFIALIWVVIFPFGPLLVCDEPKIRRSHVLYDYPTARCILTLQAVRAVSVPDRLDDRSVFHGCSDGSGWGLFALGYLNFRVALDLGACGKRFAAENDLSSDRLRRVNGRVPRKLRDPVPDLGLAIALEHRFGLKLRAP